MPVDSRHPYPRRIREQVFRSRPLTAVATAVIVLAVAVGGAAYAGTDAVTLGKKITKSTVKKIAKKQIKKAAPGLSVSHASTADSATNADNATTTDGITAFTYAAAGGSTNKTVLNDFHGLTLTASCTAGVNQGLTVKASSSQAGAYIAYSAMVRNDPAAGGNDSVALSSTPATIMSPGGTVDTGNGSIGIGFSSGQIVYSAPQTGVSVTWQYTGGVGSNPCLWTGTATGTSDGPPAVNKAPAPSAGGPTSAEAARAAR